MVTALLGIGLSAPSYGQESSQPSADAGQPGILRQYDQAIDEVAEKAMRSVVEIEVTSLGIFVIDLNDFVAAALPGLRSKHGVVVAGVLGEEPATMANLEVGDVVRSINGKPLSTTDDLRQQLAGMKPGDAVALEVERQSVLQYVAFEIE